MTSTPSRSLSLIAALMLSAAAAACGQDAGAPGLADATQTPAPSAPEPTAPPPEPAKTGASSATSSSEPATPAASRKPCYLSVDGKVLLNESCLVYPFGDGGYTMNAWSEGKPKNSQFAVVALMADGSADATWNADPDDDKAGDRLGTVRLSDGCWINDRARICVG
ncbi:hypothetical protein [Brevundimonas vesicularis]|uniref:hypothetical protein n=1 Tax=Brevundimonas vesicularis TaxID=41276 RepID=UPI0022AC0F88|nr:hypothetical protein [Brevundimonas vesicularis]